MLKNAAHPRCANCSKIDEHSPQKPLIKHASQMTPPRYLVNSNLKGGLKPRGSSGSACRCPLSPRPLRDAGSPSPKARQTSPASPSQSA